ncbi:MAG: hypothetical protein EPN82_00485 [Bacteroidetes bacterium]|nr:MAG: hypothetical protein EPN82_00485 [Bacteroidota bacterium]
MKKYLNSRLLLIIGIILAAIISRLVTHIPNVNPIMAIALFGAAYFPDKKLAIIIPVVAMFISDLIIGLHETIIAVYLSFGIGALIGFLLLKKTSIPKVILASLLSSTVFFIITNFAVWLMTDLYTFTYDGFVKCYTLALPFFRNALIGDMVYCTIMFGGFVLLEKFVPKFRLVEN